VTAGALGSRAARAAAAERLASGAIQIAVGTHALIQEKVRFGRLGLAVVDEQHRFGVVQRDDLARKGGGADVLVLTATPIPRSLALTAYGDLDLSVVDERPPGRTPIVTRGCRRPERRAVVEAVRAQVAEGRQAYVVYPLVEESEKLEDVRAATQMAEEWRRALPGVRVGLLHGRLKSAEKEAGDGRVRRARARRAGGDHGDRGRGRRAERHGDGDRARGALRAGPAPPAPRPRRPGGGRLLLRAGEPRRLSDEARSRLQVMVATDDGFEIAERDLELRGPGDFFGTRQWGLPGFRAARLIRDRDLLEKARAEATRFAAEGAPADRAALRAFLDDGRWEKRFGLARVG
jgi:ATP-dependent DNA helicase RecG